jgi:hypothetical protein
MPPQNILPRHITVKSEISDIANSTNLNDREFIWRCLADFFTAADVENSPDFARLADFSVTELKEIFFDEVAPACGHNLFVTTPILSEGFDPDWVTMEIRRILARRDSGSAGRICYNTSFLFYRCVSGKIWREAESALGRISRN